MAYNNWTKDTPILIDSQQNHEYTHIASIEAKYLYICLTSYIDRGLIWPIYWMSRASKRIFGREKA